jgi:hypothetical protein
MKSAAFCLSRFTLLIFVLTLSVYGQGLPTKTLLTVGPNPGTVGSNVTYTATVNPQVFTSLLPTGSVTFSDGLGDLYTMPVEAVTSGSNTYAEALLILQPAAGNYTFTATYSGDSNFAPSPVSLPVSEVVDPATIVNITVSANPGIYGEPIAITASVTPSTATGTITFYDIAVVLGVVPVVNGSATLKTNLLQSGLRSLTARYDGDANDVPGTSAVLTVGILSERGLGFAPATTYPSGATPNAAMTADVNGDGILDMVVVNAGSGTISVFLGNSNGTFQSALSFPTGSAPVAGVIGDFNGDGKPDVAIASGDGVDLLFGNGDGTFQPFVTISIGSAAGGIAMADFNSDGFPDIVSSNVGQTNVTVLLGNGDGTFPVSIPCSTGPSGTHPGGIGIGDFDTTQTPDIAVADDGGVTIIMGTLTIASSGVGTFSCQAPSGPYPVGYNSSSLEVKDFTGNNIQDIAVTDYNNGFVSVLLGNGDGTFTLKGSYPTDPHPVALASADFNGDGIPDLVVTDGSSTAGMNLFVLLGRGDGSFYSPLGYASDPSMSGVVAAAFVQNGQADVAAVSSATGNLDVLLNGFPTLTITAGNTQTTSIYNTFPVGLTVNATGFGSAAAQVPVTFTASNGFFSGLGGTAVVMTDGSGNATAPAYTANGVTGPNNVTASSGGNTVTFALTNTVQPCTFTISPSSLLFTANGGEATFTVTPSASNCDWSAATSDPGILIGNPSGIGNGTVNVLIPQNTTGTVLSETIFISGQAIPVQVDETSQIFADVPDTAYYFDEANLMYEKGITSGCSTTPLDYCPTETVTRAEMAVFLVRAIFGGDNFTPPTGQIFSDVPPSSTYYAYIQELSTLGITAGCGNGMYCPNNPVTRAEMAIFIIRARYGSATQFDYPQTPYFTDVPSTSFEFAWVQRLAYDDITSGCGVGLYCPNNNVLRQDMAVFIMRGLYNQFLPSTEPILVSVGPASIPAGTITTVTVTGVNTNFVQGSTVVNVSSPNFTAGVPTVTSPTTFTVPLTTSATATNVPNSIWVTTGTQEAVLPNGLIVQ